MNRLLKTCLTSALLLGSVFSLHAADAAPPRDLKGVNVVLVHGAFADGSSWEKVIPLLEARGLHVVQFRIRSARSLTIRRQRGAP